jgi:hypothetical protein
MVLVVLTAGNTLQLDAKAIYSFQYNFYSQCSVQLKSLIAMSAFQTF